MLSPYLLQENDEYSYEFLTEQGIRYAIYFLDYSFIFSDYPAIAENVFSFNIEVLDGDADISITDERIGVTILEIFNLFFKKLANVAVSFVIVLTIDNWQENENLICGFGNTMTGLCLKKMVLH